MSVEAKTGLKETGDNDDVALPCGAGVAGISGVAAAEDTKEEEQQGLNENLLDECVEGIYGVEVGRQREMGRLKLDSKSWRRR